MVNGEWESSRRQRWQRRPPPQSVRDSQESLWHDLAFFSLMGCADKREINAAVVCVECNRRKQHTEDEKASTLSFEAKKINIECAFETRTLRFSWMKMARNMNETWMMWISEWNFVWGEEVRVGIFGTTFFVLLWIECLLEWNNQLMFTTWSLIKK